MKFEAIKPIADRLKKMDFQSASHITRVKVVRSASVQAGHPMTIGQARNIILLLEYLMDMRDT